MPKYFKCSICDLHLEIKYQRAFFIHIASHETLFQIKWPLNCGQYKCTKTLSNIRHYKDHLNKHVSDINMVENLELSKKTDLIKNSDDSCNAIANDSKNDDNCNDNYLSNDYEAKDDLNLSNECLKSEIKNRAFKLINHFQAKNQLSNT